jgi:hypothetical protein
MNSKETLSLRIAVAIHEHLHPSREREACSELPTAVWQQCESLQRRIERATRHNWNLAARRLRSQLQVALGRLHSESAEVEHRLFAPDVESQQTTIRDLYADLVALHHEFDEVSFDRRCQTISVTTEPIELEGTYLGPFTIRLDWSDLTDGHPHNYKVIANDPHPAATNDCVTHPHVQDEGVCEGDGHHAIRRALSEGRLLDFFVIVANLLRTYNSGSPFVALSDWYGFECADCGSTVSEDDRSSCEKCGTTVCGDCYFNCPGCAGCFCSECITRCESCDEHYCSVCLKPCSSCEADSCQDCLDNKERCTDCHDKETDQETQIEGGNTRDVPDIVTQSDTRTRLQPDRVGEVAVPA